MLKSLLKLIVIFFASYKRVTKQSSLCLSKLLPRGSFLRAICEAPFYRLLKFFTERSCPAHLLCSSRSRLFGYRGQTHYTARPTALFYFVTLTVDFKRLHALLLVSQFAALVSIGIRTQKQVSYASILIVIVTRHS